MIRMPTRFSATRLILRDDHGLKPAALRPSSWLELWENAAPYGALAALLEHEENLD